MKFRLFVLPLLALLLACCPAGAAAQVVLQHYGVNDIETSQYGFLKDSLKGNFALVELSSDSLTWKNAISAAEQHNISLIIWPLGHGDRYTPWLCNVFTWDISEGLGAMTWAERYVASGGKALCAVLTTHEPFYSAGTEKVFNTNQLQTLYATLKNVAPHVKLFAYLNDISYYDSTQSYRQMKDSVVDIAGIYKHHFGTKHTLKETLDEIESDYALIKRKGLNVQLYFALQCFATDGIEYRMPSAAEMRAYADTVIATKKLAGVFWYPWERSSTSYTQWLSKDRYDSSGGDRWAVVREKSSYLTTGVRPVEHARPTEITLFQNFPNPANPSTQIKYTIGEVRSGLSGRDSRSGGPEGQGPGVSRIRLVVYDLLGREVAVLVDGREGAGSYSVNFDGSGLSSGAYFYVLSGNGVRVARRMIILR